jgi:hypothetical protein
MLSAANAAVPKSSGVYIGGAAGSAKLEDDNLFADSGVSLDDEDASVSFIGGYKFNPYFSLEARYSFLGSYTVSALNGFSYISEDVDISSLSIHVVGTVPLGQSGFSLFGQLGAASLMADCSGCDDSGAGSAGFGVAYNFTEGLALALQVDAYAWQEDGYYKDYDFSITTAQLALRYVF